MSENLAYSYTHSIKSQMNQMLLCALHINIEETEFR